MAGQCAILACLLMAACTNYKKDTLYPQVCMADTLVTVSFSKDIVPVFSKNCALSGCHSGSNATGALNLDSAEAFASLSKSGSGYLDVNDPASSLVYVAMTSAADIMPKSGKLDACTTNLVLKWIKQGALNN